MSKDFNFLLYQSALEDVSVNALVKDETVWLTQKAMADLFGVDKSSISKHLKNIFAEGELSEEVVVAKIATTTQHGALDGKTQTRDVFFYNLDAIISVGYRVNSRRATHFRIWAAAILTSHAVSMQWYRISPTMRSRERPARKSSSTAPTAAKIIWG